MNDAAPAAARPVPRIEDFPCKAGEIIRLNDIDHQGHVNNVVFAIYMETGRVQLMHEVFGGLSFERKNFVVGRLEINFLRELHWPGTVDTCTGVERIGTSSVTYAHGVFHNGECAATGRTTMVFIDRATRRSTPMTEEIVARLRAHMMK
ncbi:MAG: acyl-CoA thioesterase [Variibacter sp.]|nr:acyl-CoA thioesterase [Variibacter sp.]